MILQDVNQSLKLQIKTRNETRSVTAEVCEADVASAGLGGGGCDLLTLIGNEPIKGSAT